MKEIFLISIILALLVIGVLTMVRDKKSKKNNIVLRKPLNTGENLTVDKDVENKKSKLLGMRKAKTINFNEGKLNTSQGIIGAQMKKQKHQEESLKKPIGWVKAQSYEEDVRTTNVSNYVHEESKKPVTTFDDDNVTNKTKPNILVVDDSVTVLKFISNLFVKINYDIVTKEDGSLAFDYLNMTNRLPDLIVTDLEMPTMSGSELVQTIRKEHRFKNIPILIVSSNPTPYIYLLENGLVNGIMQKPFDKEEFMGQVKYLINN